MSDRPPGRRVRRLRLRDGGEPVRPFPLHGWIAVVTAAVLLFWSSVPTLVGFYDLSIGAAFALATLHCLAMPLAVRRPRAAVLLHLVAMLLIGHLTGDQVDSFWPLPVPALLTLMVLLAVLGLREDWPVPVAAWWLSFLALTVVVLTSASERSTPGDWGVDVLVSITLTLVVLATTVAVGQRQRVRQALAEARRDVELEQAKRSTVEERARIARELHDVVAHSMSIVHIRAESARYRVDDLEEAREEFDDIARSARSALEEMRQLLGALRPPDHSSEYAPQPGISDIADLVTSTEKVGHRVRFSNDVDPTTSSPVTQLTAYRIVQEALSNVVRHAPGAAVQVTLTGAPHQISIRVRNQAPTPTGPPTVPRFQEVGGHGLRGMRERVQLLEGHVVQQAQPDGGFLVEATLPVSTPPTERGSP